MWVLHYVTDCQSIFFLAGVGTGGHIILKKMLYFR